MVAPGHFLTISSFPSSTCSRAGHANPVAFASRLGCSYYCHLSSHLSFHSCSLKFIILCSHITFSTLSHPYLYHLHHNGHPQYHPSTVAFTAIPRHELNCIAVRRLHPASPARYLFAEVCLSSTRPTQRCDCLPILALRAPANFYHTFRTRIPSLSRVLIGKTSSQQSRLLLDSQLSRFCFPLSISARVNTDSHHLWRHFHTDLSLFEPRKHTHHDIHIDTFEFAKATSHSRSFVLVYDRREQEIYPYM